MQFSDFRPARDWALRYGVKSVVYGPPGSGKTPLIDTAPRPILMACEPGLRSMSRSLTPTVGCFTTATIDDFFSWLEKSHESRNFDTVGIDSSSQLAEIYLADEFGRNKDGRKVYGNMATRVMKHLSTLFFMQQKHAYLVAKQKTVDVNSVLFKIPYFPGQDLPIKVPHLYDLVMHLDTVNVPNVGQQKAFRCWPAYDVMARDRSGMLLEFEPPNVSAIFAKAMQ